MVNRLNDILRRGLHQPWLVPAIGVLGLVVGVVGLLQIRATAGECHSLHFAIQFAGSSSRLQSILGACTDTNLGASVGWDFVFIAGYWTLCTAVLVGGWWHYEAPNLRRIAVVVVGLPTVVAVLDVIENILILLFVRRSGAGYVYTSDCAAAVLSSVAWSKWLLAVGLITTTVMALFVWFSRRSDRIPRELSSNQSSKPLPPLFIGSANDLQNSSATVLAAATTAEFEAMPVENGSVGVCFSGGGIRSAAFALGVLTELEKQEVMDQARWVTGVSGGSWSATAWVLHKAFRDSISSDSAAEAVIRGLQNRVDPRPFTRQKYLLNGRGGIAGSLVWVLGCVVVNLVLLGAIIFAFAWPLGWILGRSVVYPGLSGDAPLDLLWAPGATVAAVGGLLLIVFGLSNFLAKGWRLAVAVLGVGIALSIYLVVIPWALRLVGDPDSLRQLPNQFKAVIGTSVIAAVGGQLWKLFGKPVTGALSRALTSLLPKLLGVLLVAGGLAWATVVMSIAGSGKATVSYWFCACAVIALMYCALSPNWPSLHDLFGKRLRRSFDPVEFPFHPPTTGARIDEGPRVREVLAYVRDQLARDRDRYPTWEQLSKRSKPTVGMTVPELVLCCAQQRNGISSGGLPAESFTISPSALRQGATVTPTSNYINRSLRVKRWFGKAEFRHIDLVTSWLATTGAAFSSAMGRASLGTTNALLAAINADLGIWLPNPTIVQRDREAAFRSIVDTADAELARVRDATQEANPQTQELDEAQTNLRTASTMLRAAPGQHHAVRSRLSAARNQITQAASGKGPDEVGNIVPTIDEAIDIAEQLRMTHGPGVSATTEFPRPRFAYLLKEILGWYSERDRFVFVTDGGHWENLGLVELLRRKCETIYCVDASGDLPGSFTTLREALELESLELGSITSINLEDALERMRPHQGALAESLATTFTATHADTSRTTTIHYVKLQATRRMPPTLRRYAIEDSKFPDYSTLQQFLTDDQFDRLVELGRYAGTRLMNPEP